MENTSRRQQNYRESETRMGVGQLSLVEHALCPLDPARSLRPALIHECQYRYSDKHRKRRVAQVRIACPLGLSSQDEFFLWGLLALTFSQPDPTIEFQATPHYCLRQLGVIDQHARRGGRQYRQFAAALERLSMVRYQNHAFYDPVRGEHRRVGFGLLSYSLPLDCHSPRAWRIVWDPLFFELLAAGGGHLHFDLDLYRDLDPASRRLLLFLSKIFCRRATAPPFDLRELAVQVLGFAPSVAMRDLKIKVRRCVTKLADREIVSMEDEATIFRHKAPGHVSLHLDRGKYFHQRRKNRGMHRRIESPLAEPLASIGLDDNAIRRLVKQYPSRLLQEWVDITLAAKERFGPKFFKKSPAAYFVDNVRNAGAGNRTPPDWWHELRRAERQVPRKKRRTERRNIELAQADSAALPKILTSAMQSQFEAAGQSKEIAQKNAKQFATTYAESVDASGPEQIKHILKLIE